MGTWVSREDENCANKGKAQYASKEAINKDSLKVIYTNADGLLNKRQHLKILIQCLPEPPDVIAITEFKPKKTSHQLLISEFNLDVYNVFHSGLGNNNDRGILFYIAYGIQASLVDIGIQRVFIYITKK